VTFSFPPRHQHQTNKEEEIDRSIDRCFNCWYVVKAAASFGVVALDLFRQIGVELLVVRANT